MLTGTTVPCAFIALLSCIAATVPGSAWSGSGPAVS
ncbi:MAG: hypothetical protein QOE41_535 [Mycobacterium sp.]|nr:hypothetical protein [Mycobacterium sp.]MDT5131224.1 hypothetical protein [Mycobacterium sp.]